MSTRSTGDSFTSDNDIVRLLVLDTNPGTPQLIENALWVWPHKIASATNAQNAIKMCQHLEPTALIVSLDFPSDSNVSIVRALRNEMPDAVIVAIGTSGQTSNPGPILDMGANAVLAREALQQPTLHDLLMRLQPRPKDDNRKIVLEEYSMPLPWRESEIVGALVCDIKGRVISANACLAKWLEYAAPSELAGKCVWRDVLTSHSDWASWQAVAGDLAAIVHHPVTVKARNEQLLWMDVEVFAAPNAPTNILAMFVDQSELAQLTGRVSSR